MNRIAAIALNTFREAIRNKILYALLFFAAVLQQPGLSAAAVGTLAATYLSFRLLSSTA